MNPDAIYIFRLSHLAREKPVRSFYLAISAAILLLGMSDPSLAQSIRFGPGGVEVRPEPERRPPPRDELRERMMGLRIACEDGDRRACVRLGIIIGENRERRESWRRENPEIFFYER
jgi:hypothetical protein